LNEFIGFCNCIINQKKPPPEKLCKAFFESKGANAGSIKEALKIVDSLEKKGADHVV
jgi:hypothetical protein